MGLALLLGAGVVVALGGLVQGVVGFGMALVAVPLLALVDPALVPVPLLLMASAHAAMSMFRERAHADWRGVSWAMLGRLPGTVVGVAVVDTLPQRAFFVLVGLAVLVCVLLSVISWRPAPTPRSLVVAGVASGAFGTAMSVGGPPVALLYQHSAGPRIRATLGAYFLLGSLTSVAALAVAGHIGTVQVAAAAALLPFLLVGFALSGPARRLLDAGWTRHAVLAVSAASAVFLVVRSILF